MKAEENPSQKQMRTGSIYMGQPAWTSPDAETPKVDGNTEYLGHFNGNNGQNGFQPSISELESQRESCSRLHSVYHPDVIY